MKLLPLLLLATLAPSFTIASAQGCLDNVFPITLVDASGAPLPTLIEGNQPLALSAEPYVYLALPANMPSGVYFVQVSNYEISAVLADSLQYERVFEVQNDGGVIAITRLASNPGLPEPGLGLGGVGQSIPLFPLIAPPEGSLPCRFKAWIGECYLPSWNPNQDPLGLPYGIRPSDAAGNCCTRSFAQFQVGDGSGTSTVSGVAFDDQDQNGQQGPGEPGLAGLTVCLTGGDVLLCTQTDASGNYSFSGVVGGNYEIALLALPDASYVATTPLSRSIEVSGCEPLDGYDFGAFQAAFVCEGRTRGFWSNPNGKALITQHNLLPRLAGLSLRTANGSLFSTTNYNTYRSWLQPANASNMAYMLSAQLVAMDFNRAVGFVGGNCRIQDPSLGILTIDQLIALAVSSLQANGHTPAGHPARAGQEVLKNALDAANNNQNWL